MPLLGSKRLHVPVDDPGYADRVAPQAVEILPDALRFPKALLLPISARAESTLPGTNQNPWSRLRPEAILTGFPMFYSVAVHKLPPAEAKKRAKHRRVATEALMRVLAEKAQKSPSTAEVATVQALDGVESAVAMGYDLFRLAFLATLFAPLELAQEAENMWHTLENRIRAVGLIPQRLYYIPEQALYRIQPGGDFFGKEDHLAFAPEILPMLPRPSRPVPPAQDAIWLGRHLIEGRDVYFSFREGLDPTGEKPTHNITLILGEQGSGKTTLMRLMITQRLLQGRAVLSIDPEGENNAMVKALGGEVVPAKVPDDPDTCLLHPLQGESLEEMFSAARFFLYAILGDMALSPVANAVIHEAIQQHWQRRPGPMSVSDLMEALALTQKKEGAILAAALRPYARGGIWEGFFDRPRALLSPHLEAGVWRSFDLTSLRDENKAVIMAVLGWFVYHAITVGRQPMDVFVDEGWYLLRSPTFRDLLDEIGRRGRKRDVGIVFITHLPSDLMKDPTSLSLASTAFIGYLPPEESYRFFRALGVPEDEARRRAEQVARQGRGQFMAAPAGGRGSLFPLQVLVPPAWQEAWRSWNAWKGE